MTDFFCVELQYGPMTSETMAEIQKLEQAIATLEAQRTTLGDSVVETMVALAQERLAALRLAGQPAPAGQRKQLTILFADVPGYTQFSENRDAEEVGDTMHALWQRLDIIVEAHNGRIDKHMGDGLMALWGTAEAREDDPEQAIRAALAMQAAVSEPTAPAAVPLSLRIGIHTGPALLSHMGLTGEYTAVGDSVNLASRLEHAAPAGGILISHDSYRLVRGIFDVEQRPPLVVRGKRKPVQTYLVRAAKPRAFRMVSRGIEGVETAMVGRAAELGQLQAAFHALLERGGPNVMTIVGEPGIGKSRLLHEWLAWADLHPARWRLFRGRAWEGADQAPYALLRDLFAFRFDIHENDTLEMARGRLEEGITSLLDGRRDGVEKAHVIGQLLGFDFSNSPHLAGLVNDPPQLRQLAFHYLAGFFQQVVQERPVVIVLDDIHWADAGSLDALRYALNQLPAGTPLLLLAAARPLFFERFPDWEEAWPHHTRLSLALLSEAESRSLVEEILQYIPDPPPSLPELITRSAEGNPLYLEELIKMLIDEQVIQPGEGEWHVALAQLTAVRIPASLTGILQARLDALPPAERNVLQRAAIYGRLFWDEALYALAQAGNRAADQRALQALGDKELIFARPTSAFAPAREYLFKHALLRDATYETVLKRERAGYHAQAAHWLSTASGQRRSEYLPLIADHYEKAGQTAEAVQTLREAGEHAFVLSASAEARTFFERALALLPDENQQRALLQLKASLACRESGDLRAAWEYSTAALATFRAEQAPALVVDALFQTAEVARYAGNWFQAEVTLREALPLARANDEPAALTSVLWALGVISWRSNNLDGAESYLTEALDLIGRSNDSVWLAPVLIGLGTVAKFRGDLVKAAQLYAQAHQLRQARNDRKGMIATLNNQGTVASESGDYQAALHYSQQALALARQLGRQQDMAMCLVNSGAYELTLGRYTQAAATLREALTTAFQVGALALVIDSLVNFAQLAAVQGNYERALGLLGLAQSHPASNLDNQHEINKLLTKWKLEPAVQAAGLARGASLDWDRVLTELITGNWL
jgi:class 3 adenylate cyclase/tetratricopeptide (TPR) repeat protein